MKGDPRTDPLAALDAVVAADQKKQAKARAKAKELNGDAIKPSEDDLALKFTATHGDQLRFVAEWGRWLLWDGAHWRFEETYLAFDLARRVARDFAIAKEDRSLAKATVVAAIERLARADRRHAAETDQWDRDLWMFNQPGEETE
jgi:putative DNA primase/helicase